VSAALRNKLVQDFDKFYKARTWSGGVKTIQVRLPLKTVQSIIWASVVEAFDGIGLDSQQAVDQLRKNSDKEAMKFWNNWYKTNVQKFVTNSGSKNWKVFNATQVSNSIIINCKLTTAGIKSKYNIEQVHTKLRTDFAKFIASSAQLKTWKRITEFEHGSLGEPDFAKPVGRGGQGKLFDPNKETRQKIMGMKKFDPKVGDMVQEQFAQNTTDGLAKAPGAAGTIVNKAIVIAGKKIRSKDSKLMDQYQQLMMGVLTDYFNWEHSTDQVYDMKKVAAEFQIRGSIEYPDSSNPSNTGVFDSGIADLFRETFIADKPTKEFVRIAQKYVKHIGQKSPKRAENLWANSPGPVTAIEAIGKKSVIDNLFPHKTNPNMRLRVNRKIYNEAKKVLGKKKSPVARTKKKKIKSRTIRTVAGSTATGKKLKLSPAARSQGRTQMSPIALRNILNEMLPEMVASKMTQPALQFRTGRFANSARVENVNMGPRGGVGIDYTYMRNPYETFEPGNKQGSTHRDPRRIIGASIRELATGILGRQPTSIRRT